MIVEPDWRETVAVDSRGEESAREAALFATRLFACAISCQSYRHTDMSAEEVLPIVYHGDICLSGHGVGPERRCSKRCRKSAGLFVACLLPG